MVFIPGLEMRPAFLLPETSLLVCILTWDVWLCELQHGLSNFNKHPQLLKHTEFKQLCK